MIVEHIDALERMKMSLKGRGKSLMVQNSSTTQINTLTASMISNSTLNDLVDDNSLYDLNNKNLP
jgi:hypothetical protein